MDNPQAMQAAIDLHQAGRLTEANAIYHRIIAADPNHAEALHRAGLIAIQLGNAHQAIQLITKAISAQPNIATFHSNLAYAFQATANPQAAVDACHKAIALDPTCIPAYTNLALALRDQRKYDDSIDACKKALARDPSNIEAHINLGAAQQLIGQLENAATTFRKTIALSPTNAVAHWNLAILLLTNGDLTEGWKEFEWRLQYVPNLRRNLPQPRWEGSDLSNKTILLHAEGGLGDTIQFVRYAPIIAAQKNARIILETQPELKSLLSTTPGVSQTIARGESLPPFDVISPLQSLPLIFGTTLQTIPAHVPYIKPNPTKTVEWQNRITNKNLRVGLAWAGSRADNRTHHLSLFAPLAATENVTFYSLQKGEASSQANIPPNNMTLIDTASLLHDFSDTAALIFHLDLIISVDTSVAHLAAAMGKPTWTLIPHHADFRWLRDRTDTPWYPTMKLFRQSNPTDWQATIEQLAQHLQRFKP